MRLRRAQAQCGLAYAGQSRWRRSTGMRWRWVLLVTAVGGPPTACGGPAPLGTRGDVCFRTEDCAEGYVCIENACSRDLRAIENTVAPPGDPAPQAPSDAGVEGAPRAPNDATVSAPAADAAIEGGGSAPEAMPPGSRELDADQSAEGSIPVSSDAAGE